MITNRIFHVNPTPLAYKRRGRGVSTQKIIIQPTHIGRRVFILTEPRTYINPCVSYVPLFSTSVSTPTLKSSWKPWQAHAHRRKAPQCAAEPLTGGNVAAVDMTRDLGGGALLAARPCSNRRRGWVGCSRWRRLTRACSLQAAALAALDSTSRVKMERFGLVCERGMENGTARMASPWLEGTLSGWCSIQAWGDDTALLTAMGQHAAATQVTWARCVQVAGEKSLIGGPVYFLKFLI
jgi:hypothetical protein